MPFLFVGTVYALLYIIFLHLGTLDFVHSLLEKVGFSLGGRALSFFLRGLGCGGSLVVAIVFIIKVMLSSESTPLVKMMNNLKISIRKRKPRPRPFQGASGKRLSISQTERRPRGVSTIMSRNDSTGCSISVVNIRSRRTLLKGISILFEKASVGFSKALLERVNGLMTLYYNNGQHIQLSEQKKIGNVCIPSFGNTKMRGRTKLLRWVGKLEGTPVVRVTGREG